MARRAVHRAARAQRWQALALLANHFLDVVRGLPTLRAFNRSRAQAERIAEVSEEYRRATMGTLRSFSGSILELAATLGIALVALVVGVRLAEGGIGFEPALTVLVLAGSTCRCNLAAQFHASADGARSRSACSSSRTRLLSSGQRARARPVSGACPLRARVVRVSGSRVPVLDDLSLGLAPGRRLRSSGRAGRESRRSCRSS